MKHRQSVPIEDPWLTVARAAELTGYHPMTIRKMVYRRELACIKKSPRGHIRIRQSELDRWAREHEHPVRRRA